MTEVDAFDRGNPFSSALARFAAMMRHVNICCWDEDDPRFVLYSIRAPAEAKLDNAVLLALSDDDTLGADLAAWLKARAAANGT
jgi:hypothetical protein